MASRRVSVAELLHSNQLSHHRYNLVLHKSSLPRRRGSTSITWHILEGATIRICHPEAFADLDALPNDQEQETKLNGHEMADASRALQAPATFDLCLISFDRHFERCQAAQSQCGEATQYLILRASDSRLDQELSRADQFNVLRVVEKQRYLTLIANFLRCIIDFQSDLADVGFPSFKLLVIMDNFDFIARAVGMTSY